MTRTRSVTSPLLRIVSPQTKVLPRRSLYSAQASPACSHQEAAAQPLQPFLRASCSQTTGSRSMMTRTRSEHEKRGIRVVPKSTSQSRQHSPSPPPGSDVPCPLRHSPPLAVRSCQPPWHQLRVNDHWQPSSAADPALQTRFNYTKIKCKLMLFVSVCMFVIRGGSPLLSILT